MKAKETLPGDVTSPQEGRYRARANEEVDDDEEDDEDDEEESRRIQFHPQFKLSSHFPD